MKQILFIIVCNLLSTDLVFSQATSYPVILEAEGAIQIGHTDNPTPDPGTIRYTGADFEGYTEEGWISLTGIPYVIDIDNNHYETVEIGDQTWMAENLRVTRYNDGTPIVLITDNTEWGDARNIPAYTWYDNSGSDYGALYNFFAVADTNRHNICPTGWHVPSHSEWTTLSDFIGGSDKAGGLLKEAGLAHWLAPNTKGINFYGYTALPGGFRGIDGNFYLITQRGDWWSRTTSGGLRDTDGYSRYIFNISGDLNSILTPKRYGISVRCLKD